MVLVRESDIKLVIPKKAAPAMYRETDAESFFQAVSILGLPNEFITGPFENGLGDLSRFNKERTRFAKINGWDRIMRARAHFESFGIDHEASDKEWQRNTHGYLFTLEPQDRMALVAYFLY